MIPPSVELIDRLLREDVPYFDLTTTLLGLPEVPARMTFRARTPVVAAATSLASGLCERVGCRIEAAAPDGRLVSADEELLAVVGTPAQLHLAWKVTANVLESAGGIATRTHQLVSAARAVSDSVEVYATRKVIPGTKELALAAVLAGGGLPHRLGLAETVLVFAQHTAFLGGVAGLVERLPKLVERACEKVVLVEVERLDDALAVAAAGAGGVQFDKVPPAQLADMVAALRAAAPAVRVIAAGGINATNAAEYAATGVSGLATSWMYGGAPADIAVTIEPS
ncbi:ModD protein [Propionicimonas sp.]|uniref:ModD protein n=1 Tax=Propionicimonas sp. TaxID=1955623 RepID=UPI0017FD83F8|nr:ModD protein [Propionicimonas sp.]MBU3976603.1 ModD protein [Actinomycetota bacterium]MBA3020397.1 ModD protein [Propionicimonas sp.]MBU3986570.1 ModD protein [Actinomycetota bacterium]MBU4007278.1 ModD protein [Actinomycetota bacterium]MBU4065031.1 ModD protein [Actinomycetota bacterium]